MIERTWAQLLVPRLETALIVGVCLLYAGSTPPSVNEPHYLGKARHYWNPQWCAGDFFLESSDAHAVFYWTFGWTTTFLTLGQAAWCGRLLVWSLFAASWSVLARRVTNRRWAGLLSSIVLLSLNHFGHLSGEWLIGGIEAKGFAYPLVFLAIARVAERQWWSVWPLLGLASSFHVLVGGWAVIACLIAWYLRRREDDLRFGELAAWLVVGGLLALPGLVPALRLTADVPAELLREANIIYAIRRLSHHLIFACFAQWNPLKPDFNIMRPLSFGLLVASWWVIGRTIRCDRMRRVNAVVSGSLLIAAVAVLLDVLLAPSDSLRAIVMRYYWFRLGDIMVPAGISLALICLLSDTQYRIRSAILIGLCTLAAAAGCLRGDFGVLARPPAFQQQQFPLLQKQDAIEVDASWSDVCQWIRESRHTPEGSIFLTPTRQQSFKWLAHRPAVVTWKDVPQDAAGLVAWWNRIEDVYPLRESPWADTAVLVNLIEQYGVTHVVWPIDAPGEIPAHARQLYHNELFEVFAIE